MNWREQIVEQMAHVADPGAFSGQGYGAGAAEQSRESAIALADEMFKIAWPKLKERMCEAAARLDLSRSDRPAKKALVAILSHVEEEFKD